MRINQFIAQATGLSRRKADGVVAAGRVAINAKPAKIGDSVQPNDTVLLDGKPLTTQEARTILLHKPTGYVCSRDGQGSETVYDLLPPELHNLKLVGRLDKDSSGLILLTNDGALTEKLTHPRHQKLKQYIVSLNRPLTPEDNHSISTLGVQLEDGVSKLQLSPQESKKIFQVSMYEGRNRQIRRTFDALGYRVKGLHRTSFGPFTIGILNAGEWAECTPPAIDSL